MTDYTAKTSEAAALPEFMAAEIAESLGGTAIKRGRHWVIETQHGFVTNAFADALCVEIFGHPSDHEDPLNDSGTYDTTPGVSPMHQWTNNANKAAKLTKQGAAALLAIVIGEDEPLEHEFMYTARLGDSQAFTVVRRFSSGLPEYITEEHAHSCLFI